MPSRVCHDPIRAALREKGAERAFDDEEIDSLVQRLADRQRRRLKEDPSADVEASWREAAGDLTAEELRAGLIEKRMRMAASRAKARRREVIDRMGGKPIRRLVAALVGDEQQGYGRSLSTDATGRALETDMWGRLESGLRDLNLFDRVANWWGKADPEFEGRVAQEMARLNGAREKETGDADAVNVAGVFNRVIERGRQLQNAEGAWIGKLEGYIVRQKHDRLRVAGGFWRELGNLGAFRAGGWDAVKDAAAGKAFDRWREVIAPLLHERTFEGLTDINMPADLPFAQAADVRTQFLQRIWWDIVTGKHEILKGMSDVGEYTPPPSKARSVSEARVLHFQDAASWMAYRRRFGGQGSLFSDVVSDVGRSARNTALMRQWGPNPEAAFKAERERLGSETATSAKLDRLFEEVSGAAGAPESLRLALVGRLIRIDQSLSKLGGIVLSAWSDAPIAAQTLARTGVNWLDGYGAVVDGMVRSKNSRQVADLLDVGARSAAGMMTARFSATDGPVGWTAGAQRLFYKINGFEFWNDGIRAGVGHMLAAHYGGEAARPYAQLHPGTRETLERFGLDAAGWDVLRRGAQALEEDGRTYLTFDAVDRIPDKAALDWAGAKGRARTPERAQRARDELGLRYRALIHETLDTATSEARGREHAAITGGTKAGTPWGEAVRLFTQFWAFPIAFVGRHVAPAMTGFAGQKPVALLAHLFLATTVFGFASMEAKQIAKGRSPRPLNSDTVIAAMLQGGGLGIYGDFLFGEYNRFGGSPLGTLGGPAVGEAERMLQMFADLRDGEDSHGEGYRATHDIGANAFRFALGNTPFVNLWYTRAALDYTIFWRMQEALSPGWATRYEERVHEQTGSDLWLSPVDAVE